jgi:hypothetical protein
MFWLPIFLAVNVLNVVCSRAAFETNLLKISLYICILQKQIHAQDVYMFAGSKQGKPGSIHPPGIMNIRKVVIRNIINFVSQPRPPYSIATSPTPHLNSRPTSPTPPLVHQSSSTAPMAHWLLIPLG